MNRVLCQPIRVCSETTSENKKQKERPKIFKRIAKVEKKRVERLNKILDGGKKMSAEDIDKVKAFHKTLVDTFKNDKKSKDENKTEEFESVQKSVEYTPVKDDKTDTDFFET